jgi:methionyl-tRNA formyltransferase
MAIIFGDIEGLGILLRVCKKLKIQIEAVVPSKKHWKVFDENQIRSKMNIGSLTPIIAPETKAIFDFINTHNISVGIINSFDFILDACIVENSKLRILNVHGGKLPEYRGANVLNWAIIRGEEEIGVTFHLVDKLVDTGPIIYELKLKIDRADTALTLQKRMAVEIEDKLYSLLPLFIENKLLLKEQSTINAKYHKKRRPEDGLFNWTFSDEEIYNLIRGLVYPWPGARYYDRSGQLIVIDQFMAMEDIKSLRKLECT